MAGDVIKFALLGLGPGGVYALLALGVVLVYRGSGVVNFAGGGFALFGAAVFFEFRDDLTTGGAIAVGVAAAAVLGALVQLLIYEAHAPRFASCEGGSNAWCAGRRPRRSGDPIWAEFEVCAALPSP